MDPSAFRKFIGNYVFLPEKDWDVISRYVRLGVVKKGDFVLRAGEVCNTFWFLEQGLLRFSVLKNGEYVTKFFTVAPYAFTSQYSFSNRLPAQENIEALEESILWKVSFEDSNTLFCLESWNTFVRKLIQEVQHFTEQILEEVQNETAENRYLRLVENKPGLVQRIPLKYLASFLGITPQSLSRIRRKVTE